MRIYRIRNIASGNVSNVDEDAWQTIKGRGWGGRYKVEEVTSPESTRPSFFRPPVEVVKLSGAPKEEVKTEAKKRGRPKKTQVDA